MWENHSAEISSILQAARSHDGGTCREAVAAYMKIMDRGGPSWVGHLAALAFHELGVQRKATEYFVLSKDACPEVGLLHGGGGDCCVNIQSYVETGGKSCASATAMYHAGADLIAGGDLLHGFGMLAQAHDLAPGIARITERLCEIAPGIQAGMLTYLADMEVGIMARYAEPSPIAQTFAPFKRWSDRDTMARARAVFAKPVIRVLLLVYDEIRDLLAESFEPERFHVVQVSDVGAAVVELERGEYDFFLTTNIYMERDENLVRFVAARKNPEALHVVWLTDLHHSHRQSLRLTQVFDFSIPAHERNTDCLRLVSDAVTSSVHMAVQQFSRDQARRLYDANEHRPRSDALYGGFRQYPWCPRNGFIEQLGAAIPDNALYIRPNTTPYEEDAYFCLSDDDKFLDWMAHKVTLHVPVHRDLSPRVFDALLAGQIPLVPVDISAFDHFFSLADQARLPIVKYEEYTIEAVSRAYGKALRLWNEGGVAAARRRHEYCLEKGMLCHRLRRMVDTVAVFAACGENGYVPRSEP